MEISKQQFIEALRADGVLRKGNLELLSFMFFAEGCEATAPQLTNALGYGDSAAPANSNMGNLGKRIASYLSIDVLDRESKSPGWWRLVATGEQKANGFTWRLRSNLADALIELNLLVEPTSADYPELIPNIGPLVEGAVSKVRINAYERNPVARRICIEHFGCACVICNFSFEAKYGEIGQGFIHVHHLKELASIGKEYHVDPVKDLRPVCPNCHAMLHRKYPAYSIEELKQTINSDC